jgi:AraC-like DNA-binding protein
MQLRSIIPSPAVSHYVHDIVVIEDDHLHRDTNIPLIAKGYPCIAFQSTCIRMKDGSTHAVEHLVLYGQNVQPFTLLASGHLCVIAYFLHPYLLKYFFGFNAKEIKDMSIELSMMRPAKGMNLKEQLANAVSLQDRLQLMDEYIRKLSAIQYESDNKAIVWSTHEIQKSKGLISLKSLQSELCVSERTFQRLFESWIGVPPSLYTKICQFNAAFNQFSRGQYDKLSDIAYENGYADQSHFIRTFREFTHLSPREYLKNMPDNQH